MKKEDKKWTKKRHKRIQSFFRVFFKPFLRHKISLKTDDITIPSGPSIIISNHVTLFDPFAIRIAINRPLYYVLMDDILSRRFVGKLLRYILNPIPKSKAVIDIKCVKTILKVLKEGESVIIFPEGNRTYDGYLCNINKSIAKLIKLSKVPLVILNVIGGYSIDPRWAKKILKGSMGITKKLVLYEEDYKKLSDDELYDLIVRNLSVDPLNLFLGTPKKNSLEYIERAVFSCPSCKEIGTIESNKDTAFCTKCGYKVKYNNNLKLESLNGQNKVSTIKEWMDLDKNFIENIDMENEQVLFNDNNVSFFELIRYKGRKKIISNSKLEAYSDKIVFKTKKEKITFHFKEIRNACAVGINRASFYFENNQFSLVGNKRFNTLKYVMLFHHFKNHNMGLDHQGEFLGI